MITRLSHQATVIHNNHRRGGMVPRPCIHPNSPSSINTACPDMRVVLLLPVWDGDLHHHLFRMDVLRTRKPVTLTKPLDLPKARRTAARREGDIACDEILFAKLRTLRKELADERRVPAYIVFGDNTLRAMARVYPESVDQMEGIPGMGEKKRAEFGEAFAAAIADYLRTNSRQAFD